MSHVHSVDIIKNGFGPLTLDSPWCSLPGTRLQFRQGEATQPYTNLSIVWCKRRGGGVIFSKKTAASTFLRVGFHQMNILRRPRILRRCLREKILQVREKISNRVLHQLEYSLKVHEVEVFCHIAVAKLRLKWLTGVPIKPRRSCWSQTKQHVWVEYIRVS